MKRDLISCNKINDPMDALCLEYEYYDMDSAKPSVIGVMMNNGNNELPSMHRI